MVCQHPSEGVPEEHGNGYDVQSASASSLCCAVRLCGVAQAQTILLQIGGLSSWGMLSMSSSLFQKPQWGYMKEHQ